MLWRKLQPDSFKETVTPVILVDLKFFEIYYFCCRNGERKKPLSDHVATFLKSLSSFTVTRKPEEARKNKWSVKQYSCCWGTAASVADLCGTEANLVAVGIQHSLSWTNDKHLLWGALYFGDMAVSKADSRFSHGNHSLVGESGNKVKWMQYIAH